MRPQTAPFGQTISSPSRAISMVAGFHSLCGLAGLAALTPVVGPGQQQGAFHAVRAADAHAEKGCEGGVDLAFGAGLQDMELHSLRARRFLHVSHRPFGIRIVWVHQQGDHPSLGNQLGKQLEQT
jgi:hypothetical protein